MAIKNLQTIGDIWLLTADADPSGVSAGIDAPEGSLAIFGNTLYIKNSVEGGNDEDWAEVSEGGGASWLADGNDFGGDVTAKTIGSTNAGDTGDIEFRAGNALMMTLSSTANSIQFNKTIKGNGSSNLGEAGTPFPDSFITQITLEEGGQNRGNLFGNASGVALNALEQGGTTSLSTASHASLATGDITLTTGTTTGDRGDVVISAEALNMSSSKIINVADGVAPKDAVNKSQLDSVSAGLDPKESARICSVTDLAGTYNAVGGTGGSGIFTNVDTTSSAIFDGLVDDSAVSITLIAGDRILVKSQTDARQNGIYVVVTAGVAGSVERASDHDGTPTNEVSGGNYIFSEGGTTCKNTGFVLQGDGDILLNGATPATDLNWVTFSAIGVDFADKTLSNLTTGPTSIPDFVRITPLNDLGIDIGQVGLFGLKRIDQVYARDINATNGSEGTLSLDSDNNQLVSNIGSEFSIRSAATTQNMVISTINSSNLTGNITMNTGDSGFAKSGDVVLFSGARSGTDNANSGSISLTTGNNTSTGVTADTGSIDIVTGDSTTGKGGNIVLQTGDGPEDTGYILFKTGSSSSAYGFMSADSEGGGIDEVVYSIEDNKPLSRVLVEGSFGLDSSGGIAELQGGSVEVDGGAGPYSTGGILIANGEIDIVSGTPAVSTGDIVIESALGQGGGATQGLITLKSNLTADIARLDVSPSGSVPLAIATVGYVKSSAWLLDGQNIGVAKNLGSTDAFDVNLIRNSVNQISLQDGFVQIKPDGVEALSFDYSVADSTYDVIYGSFAKTLTFGTLGAELGGTDLESSSIITGTGSNEVATSTSATGSYSIVTGDITDGTGATGSISMTTGTPDAGARGTITLDADQNDSRLAVSPDDTEALAIATVGYVLSKVGSGTWNLSGNTGTTAGTDFLGTTDAQDVVFKRDSAGAGGVKLTIGATETSTNQKIVPSSADSIDLGSASARYASIYGNNLVATDGTNSITSFGASLLTTASGSFDFHFKHNTLGEKILLDTIDGAGVTGDLSLKSGDSSNNTGSGDINFTAGDSTTGRGSINESSESKVSKIGGTVASPSVIETVSAYKETKSGTGSFQTATAVATTTDTVSVHEFVITGADALNDESVVYKRTLHVENVGGVVSIIIVSSDFTSENVSNKGNFDVQFVVTGTTVELQVKATTAISMDWRAHISSKDMSVI